MDINVETKSNVKESGCKECPHYQHKIKADKKDHPKNGEITSKISKTIYLLTRIARQNWTFSPITTDIIPLSPDDTLLPLGADTSVPDTFIIRVSHVANSLSRFKANKAVGPDEIPNWILRDYATILAPPITVEMHQSKTPTQSTTTEAHSERPTANITHTGTVQVRGSIHLRLGNGHRRRPS